MSLGGLDVGGVLLGAAIASISFWVGWWQRGRFEREACARLVEEKSATFLAIGMTSWAWGAHRAAEALRGRDRIE